MRASDVSIAIFGPLSLQNQLLVYFLQNKLGTRCCFCDRSRSSFFQVNGKNEKPPLILVDCSGLCKEEILDFLNTEIQSQSATASIVLFNLNPEFQLENEAILHGVRGLLYTYDCLENLVKAIETTWAGEIWISRKKLAECLYRECLPNRLSPSAKKLPDLTKREIQILSCLVRGDSNQMISEKLCISTHTVKSHLSHIYGKISVTNRRQAAVWALENL